MASTSMDVDKRMFHCGSTVTRGRHIGCAGRPVLNFTLCEGSVLSDIHGHPSMAVQ